MLIPRGKLLFVVRLTALAVGISVDSSRPVTQTAVIRDGAASGAKDPARFVAMVQRIMHGAGAASNLTRMFGLRLASGQHPGDDVSRVEQDGFVLLRRDLDEA